MSTVAELVALSLRFWQPPPRVTLSEWCDEFYYLSAESAAEPGKWHTLPYQKGILDAITDPAVEQVTVMKSARIGYTKCINATVGYYMQYDPCPVMVVQPTIEDAQGYSKEEIAPMLRDCPVLAKLVPEPSAKDSDNTILHKLFPGGSLSIVGANSPRGFRRVSRKVVIFDETDGYPPSAGTEGDQIKLGIRRTEYYWDRKIIAGSTPTVGGRSRIERLYAQGDQRRYYVPCPHCGFRQVLKFANFKWPKGQPEKAEYMCEDCGALIPHSFKRDMVAAGEWRATAPFLGHASFHIWAAYSYSPNATWGQLCQEFVEAERGGPEELKTFVNTVLGEVWQDRGEAPDWERLYRRREGYAAGTVPEGVLFLTAGADVQKDRLVWEVVGWGRGKESWSIDCGVIPGDTATAAPWKELDALLERTFETDTAVSMPVAMLAVDSGYNTQVVYNWARTKPMSRVIAVKGQDKASVLIGTPTPVDVKASGRRIARGYKVWPVGVRIAKSELYGWLQLDAPLDAEDENGEAAHYPAGYCHFPEYGEDYFKQVTAEQQVPHRKRNGYVSLEWELIPGRENHYLDCRVYARAAAAVVGLDRFKPGDWDRLAHTLGRVVRTPAKQKPQAEAEAGQQPAPRAKRAGNWIERGGGPRTGRGGWLDRRR